MRVGGDVRFCGCAHLDGITTKVARDREKIVSKMDGAEFSHVNLVSLIMSEAGVKERAAKDRITDLLAVGMIEKDPTTGEYRGTSCF